jgi:hypothetical protein
MQLQQEVFFCDPGTVETMVCPICGTTCHVKRNVRTPTSWASAMAKKYSVKDVFTCPNAETPWHDAALAITKEISNTSSKRLANLLQQDLDDLVRENGQSANV